MSFLRYLLLFFPFCLCWAGPFVLANNSLILTHPSKYYHTDRQSKEVTQKLMRENQGPIYALAQWPIEEDKQWYALPIEMIDVEFYSRAGEHEFIFPKDLKMNDFHVTLAGGYLSACLGRTLTGIVSEFILRKNQIETLHIHLPMKAIFTGFTLREGKLWPVTNKDESIFDDSVDAFNLNNALSFVEKKTEFLQEAFHVALLRKYPMNKVDSHLYQIEVYLHEKFIFELQDGTRNSVKKKQIQIYIF